MQFLKNATLTVIAAAFMWMIPAAGFALQSQKPALSMEELTSISDEVLLGKVTNAQVKFVDKHFETEYDVLIGEKFKSASSKDFAPGRTIKVTLPGGTMTTPPLSQYAVGTPYMYKSEEVILFMNTRRGAAAAKASQQNPNSTLYTSPRIVAEMQGKFTVLTDKEGRKKVTRVNLETFGLLNDGDTLRQTIDAVVENRMRTEERRLVRAKKLDAEAAVRDPLELTPKLNKNVKMEKAAQQAELMKQIRSRTLPLQDLDSFRSEIMTAVTSGK